MKNCAKNGIVDLKTNIKNEYADFKNGSKFGSASASKFGTSEKTIQNITRDDIIQKLDGITIKSTEIANGLKSGELKLNVLGDELFEAYLGCSPETMAMQVGKQIYVRNSSSSIYSDIVHEGTHALDFVDNFGKEGLSIWDWEKRAYSSENEFQIGLGISPQFTTEDDMMVHIWGNYKNEIYEPYKYN